MNDEANADQVPPEVEREFQSQLDVYSNAWEQDLRDHLQAISGDEDGGDEPAPEDAVESLDESRAASLIERASQIIFDPQTGIYP